MQNLQPLPLLSGYSGSDVSAGRLMDSAEALPADEIDEVDADEYVADEDSTTGPKTTVCILVPHVLA
jgi:hypothetical protein